MEFQVLGPLRVLIDGVPVSPGPPKSRALLACLVVHANEVVPTERLAGYLWGEQPPATALHSVQNHISELRKVIRGADGESPIVTHAPGYLLQLERDQVDAWRFESLVDEARVDLRDGRPEEAAARLVEALGMWRGDPLVDFTYEEFAQPEIRRLAERHAEAMEALYEAQVALGRYDDVLPELESFVAEHPLRERPRRLLMMALNATGRPAEAIGAYAEYRRVLADELGLEPSGELRALEEQILVRDAAVAGAATAAGSLVVAAAPVAREGQAESDRRLMQELLNSLQADVEQRTRGRRRGIVIGALVVAILVLWAVLAWPGGSPTIGMLYAGRGDAGWGDLLAAAVDQAHQQAGFDLEERLVSLADSESDFEGKLRELSEASDLVVVGWGFAAEALATVAPDYPDTMYVMVDGAVQASNVASFVFDEEEGAYLVGAAAALVTEGDRVGFIGGADLPPIDRYLAGFRAGVQAIDPDVLVLVDYVAPAEDPVRGFVDTVTAGELARSMYREQVDVIFHAAGRAGMGILSAARLESEAQGRQLWMIGVAVDEYLAAPDDLRPHVLTSMLERGDVAVQQAITSYLDGDLEAGVTELGIAEGAVGYSTSGGFLDEYLDLFEELEVPAAP